MKRAPGTPYRGIGSAGEWTFTGFVLGVIVLGVILGTTL